MRPHDKLEKASVAFCQWAGLSHSGNGYGLVLDDGESTTCLNNIQAINVKNCSLRLGETETP
jgi:hypothetical protein